MISTITYNGDGVTRIFPVSFEIQGEDYVVTYINDVAVSDKTKYDIINNSIVFVEGQAPAIGINNVQIVVASSPTEIADLNAPPSSVQTVLDNLVSITAVADDLTNINMVATNITSINNVNTNIVPNIAEILQADDNAIVATIKAAEAVVAAGDASTSAASASASQNKAYAWSSTPEDTQVETGLYSALHWAKKAQGFASTIDTSNFVDKTSDQIVSGTKTFTSFPITPIASPTTNYQTANKIYVDTNFVDNSTVQTIAGIKTFSSSPIVPTATIAGQAIPMGGIIEKTGAKIGYGAGSGGSVTQLTSKSTGVTLNKVCGKIITSNASLAAGATVGFTFTNSLFEATDILLLSLQSGDAAGGSSYNIWNGTGTTIRIIYIKNITAGALSEALTINFAIFGGATA